MLDTRRSAESRVRLPGAGRLVQRFRSIALPLRLLIGAVAISGLATCLVIALPPLHFAYRQSALHVALETSAALIALLAAYLVFGRFQRHRHLNDLVLCYALVLLALSNLFFASIPAITGDGSTRFATWCAASGRLLGTAGFCAAAFAPPLVVRLRRLRLTAVLITVPALLALVALTVDLLGTRLPQGVETLFPPEASGRPKLIGDTSVLGLQLASMALFVAAAVGYSRRATREHDEFARWLAAASVFGAFAGLNYFLYPSLYSEWVYTGDFFRLALYVSILAAAVREIGSYWTHVSRAAALDERRRIARDLHDGLAQELAYISRNLQRLDREDPNVARLSASAARALDESRRAIAALTRPLDGPFDLALAAAARETAEREGARVVLALDPDVELDYERREAFVRIACEAIANAARHSGTPVVRVELEQGERVYLRVVDNGRGFDPESTAGRAGFGVASMRERAAAVGGTLTLESGPDGTTVEVAV
jgi:signal transduction histidine kinase